MISRDCFDLSTIEYFNMNCLGLKNLDLILIRIIADTIYL
jgi:hypothetical protein